MLTLGILLSADPFGIYFFKVINGNTTVCESCSKLIIKASERCYWRRPSIFFLNSYIFYYAWIFLRILLNFEQFCKLSWCFHGWFWISKFRLGKAENQLFNFWEFIYIFRGILWFFSPHPSLKIRMADWIFWQYDLQIGLQNKGQFSMGQGKGLGVFFTFM